MSGKINSRVVTETLVLIVLSLVALIALRVDIPTHINNTSQDPDWPSTVFLAATAIAFSFWLWVVMVRGKSRQEHAQTTIQQTAIQTLVVIILGLTILGASAIVLAMGPTPSAYGYLVMLMFFGLAISMMPFLITHDI